MRLNVMGLTSISEKNAPRTSSAKPLVAITQTQKGKAFHKRGKKTFLGL